MKRFLSTLAVWAVLMLLGTFFFASFFWGHIFRTALLLAVVFTIITLAFLEQDERISWVNYPGLKSSPDRALVEKYLPHGTCGVISFGVKGGREAAEKFMNHLELAAIVTHVADTRTCVLHPASTTHRQLSDKELEECGVTPDMIRFSVGIENVEDILADIEQALASL